MSGISDGQAADAGDAAADQEGEGPQAAEAVGEDQGEDVTREQALARMPKARWYGEEAQRGFLLDSLIALGAVELDSPRALDAEVSEKLTGAQIYLGTATFKLTRDDAINLLNLFEVYGFKVSKEVR